VDVLCWGGTHRFDAFEYMDKFFVNPGSATGAFATGWKDDKEEPTPSFCLMDVRTTPTPTPTPYLPLPSVFYPHVIMPETLRFGKGSHADVFF
jgi:vacuolar protein sorting-associated protein 29